LIGSSDEAQVVELLAPLARLEPVAFAGWQCPERRPLLRRPIFVAAVVVGALALTGFAIAAGLGAFNGISAARNTPIGSRVLPKAVLEQIKKMHAVNVKRGVPDHLLPSTARVLGTAPDGSKVYGLTDTRGDLCLIGEVGGGCGPPLSHSQPITFGAFNPIATGAGTFYAGGVAIDGVTSVSFKVWNHPVTVPVRHNVWLYKRPHSSATGATCIVAHFADGSSVVPAWPGTVPCP
jgi:hypothetical protein